MKDWKVQKDQPWFPHIYETGVSLDVPWTSVHQTITRYDEPGRCRMTCGALKLKPHRAFYREAQDLIIEARDRCWPGMVLTGWEERGRINSYTVDDHHTEHTDYHRSDASKLAIVQLRDLDFEGGAFFLGEERIEMEAGYAYVFPSFLPHRVEPITSGERVSFTAWATGPRLV